MKSGKNVIKLKTKKISFHIYQRNISFIQRKCFLRWLERLVSYEMRGTVEARVT